MARHGLALFAVLVAIVVGALAATTAILVSDAAQARTGFVLAEQQARRAAVTGLDAVLAQFDAQREVILSGEEPSLEPAERFGAFGYELVAIGDDALAESANAAIDINTASRARLEALGDVSPALSLAVIDEILTLRTRGPIESIDDLATLADNEEGRRLLTATAFDPAITTGAGTLDPGVPRVPLGGDASAVSRQVRETFGAEIARALESASGAASAGRLSDLCAALGLGRQSAEAAVVLDVFTPSDGAVRTGLVDINRAPADVLAVLPGLTVIDAEAIIATREALDESAKRSLWWPVESGAVAADLYTQAVDYVTVRSTQWRVRVRGGAVTEEGALAPRPIAEFEVVIDLSGSRARLATIADRSRLALRQAVAAEEDRGGTDPVPPDTMQTGAATTSGPEAGSPGRRGRWMRGER